MAIVEKELLEFNFVSVPCEVQSSVQRVIKKREENAITDSTRVATFQDYFTIKRIKMEEEDQTD